MRILNSLIQASRKTVKSLYLCNLLFTPIFGVNDLTTTLKCAESLFNEGMYLDAIPFYKKAVFSGLENEEELKDQLLLRLAACHLNQNDPQSAHHYLSLLNRDKTKHHPYFFYLMGLTFGKLGDKKGELIFLSKCLPSNDDRFYSNLLALEKGNRLYQMGELDGAVKELESIPPPSNNFYMLTPYPIFSREFTKELEQQKIYQLAQLNLIKIFLKRREFSTATTILNNIRLSLNDSSPLYVEMLYLDGVRFYLQGDANQGIACFEKLLSQTSTSHPIRSTYLLKNILTCYLEQVSNGDQTVPSIYAILLKGKNVLLELFSKDESTSQWNEKETILAEWLAQLSKYKALLHIHFKEWELADEELNQLIQSGPPSNIEGEAWFWRGYCAETCKKKTLMLAYYQKAYTLNPDGQVAPVAYFRTYSYLDYLHGQKKSIKHLQAMPSLFPNHPLLISAYFLMGLYHKKDHLSNEGGILRTKDLTAACEAFDLAELTFYELVEKKSMPNSDFFYFFQVCNRSQLEKGKTYFLIAQSSKEGKKQIYLKYAEKILTKLIHKLEQEQDFNYSVTWAEAEFMLFQINEEMGNLKDQKSVLNSMLAHFQQADINEGYWLSKAWFERGKLAKLEGDYSLALYNFKEAEKSSSGTTKLSPDEKLELLIQQSLCHRELNQLEEAMRLLSQVINENVISSIRIKAMFLRAEIYELQGRTELALKQLESTARKGGEWAQKAKKKMECSYGY